MSKVQCLQCKEILESKYRHDFQQCKCSNETFVDGGNEMGWRCGGKDMNKIKVLGSIKGKYRNRFVYEGLQIKCSHCNKRVRPQLMYTGPGATWFICPNCMDCLGKGYLRCLKLHDNCKVDDVRRKRK